MASVPTRCPIDGLAHSDRAEDARPESLRSLFERVAAAVDALESELREALPQEALGVERELGRIFVTLEELTERDREQHAEVVGAQDELIEGVAAALDAIEARVRGDVAALRAREAAGVHAGGDLEEAVDGASIPGPAGDDAPAPADPRPGPYAGEPAEPKSHGERTRLKLDVLRDLLAEVEPVLVPEPHPYAPLGHACASVDRTLGMSPGEGLAALEDLADLGLLERELHDQIHLCPRCHRCQINFRETCPTCGSIDTRVERMLHHFRCAYTGIESEFAFGLELVCPKCRRELHQLGQDFERPHDTYVCHGCERLFEEPAVLGQCLCCRSAFRGAEVEVARIYRYRPTPLAVRAVELGRLTGLDVSQIMYDANVRLATRDLLEFETQREVHRVRRYKSAFSIAIMTFERNGRPYSIFRDWPVTTVREFAGLLTSLLRPLDLVCRLGSSHLALLLLEADAPGVQAVERRLFERLEGFTFTDRQNRPLAPSWYARTWTAEDATIEGVVAFLDEVDDES